MKGTAFSDREHGDWSLLSAESGEAIGESRKMMQACLQIEYERESESDRAGDRARAWHDWGLHSLQIRSMSANSICSVRGHEYVIRTLQANMELND
jgi:hypothetical protein